MHHAPCGGAAAGAPSDLPVVFLVRHDGEEASSEVAALLAARLQQERPTRLSDELLPQEVIGLAPVSSEPPSLLIMIVTCEADGSVSRSVRKLVRELKSRARQQRCQTPEAMEMATREGGELKGLRCALIALGRAKCSSSAMSTKDTVYGTARQLFKLLPHAGGASVQEPPSAGLSPSTLHSCQFS